MNQRLSRTGVFLLASMTLALQGCGAGNVVQSTRLAHVTLATPKSLSPGSIPAPPMAYYVAPASLMNGRRPQSTVAPLGWTQLPGGATQVAAASDGTLYALSTLSPNNSPDKYIFHYAGGKWTNIPGAATRLATVPGNGNSIWVVNTAGGIYQWVGSWQQLGGGGTDITVAPNGQVYVISTAAGDSNGRAIWKHADNVWTQMPGEGQRIIASTDTTGTYPGGISPGGYYVLNPASSIYYYDPTAGSRNFPAARSISRRRPPAGCSQSVRATGAPARTRSSSTTSRPARGRKSPVRA